MLQQRPLRRETRSTSRTEVAWILKNDDNRRYTFSPWLFHLLEDESEVVEILQKTAEEKNEKHQKLEAVASRLMILIDLSEQSSFSCEQSSLWYWNIVYILFSSIVS